MKEIRFSVAMSVYHKDNTSWFKKALKSVYTEQKLKPSEVTLVVDGPVEIDLNEAINQCKNEITCLKVIWLKENRGLGNALRIAVNECSYEWVARMDSDDNALPTRFSEQVEFIQTHSNVDVVGGDIEEFIEEESVLGKRLVPTSHERICSFMKHRCPFNHMTVMFRRDKVIAAGNYQDWYLLEAHFLWLRMRMLDCKFANTGTVLVRARVGRDFYKRRGGLKRLKSMMRLQLFMKNRNITTIGDFVFNVLAYLTVNVMPSDLRAVVYKRYVRS